MGQTMVESSLKQKIDIFLNLSVDMQMAFVHQAVDIITMIGPPNDQ